MKTLHLSTYDSGGAGKAAYRIHCGLKQAKVDSKMLVLRRSSQDCDVVELTESDSLVTRFKNKIKKKLIFREIKGQQRKQKEELIFSNERSIYRLKRQPVVREAEVINLHWVVKMVDYKDFFLNLGPKPIVWTLHDHNPFTGGCHCLEGCNKYEIGCGYCPQLGSRKNRDLSRKILERKKKVLEKANINIVAPSFWLAEQARQSQLFKDCPIKVIPHGVPINVFIKKDRFKSRNLLGLPQDKTIILFGADYKSKNKGFQYLVEALSILGQKINTSKLALVIFGAKQDIEDKLRRSDLAIYQLGYFYDEESLANVYSAADVVVIPSLEEAFGLLLLESMACGIPAVAFNIGGINEIMVPNETGLWAEVKNSQELAAKIAWLINHPQERQRLGHHARERVEKKYALKNQVAHYINLYQEIIGKPEKNF
ncbi:MAG: glycosyltransferase family 4 protein [Candidatus Omnitrophica bacterium]|nr:glycosyltransferase family 4 protein [Candidatus Omnitrophota bacterium]